MKIIHHTSNTTSQTYGLYEYKAIKKKSGIIQELENPLLLDKFTASPEELSVKLQNISIENKEARESSSIEEIYTIKKVVLLNHENNQ